MRWLGGLAQTIHDILSNPEIEKNYCLFKQNLYCFKGKSMEETWNFADTHFTWYWNYFTHQKSGMKSALKAITTFPLTWFDATLV